MTLFVILKSSHNKEELIKYEKRYYNKYISEWRRKNIRTMQGNIIVTISFL